MQRTYPYQHEDPRGGLRFSRLADQANPAYEDAYGYWIPGNARDALLAIFLFGQMSEVMEAVSALADSAAIDGPVPTHTGQSSAEHSSTVEGQ